MVSLAVDNLIAALGEGPDAGHPPSPVNPDALATTSTNNTIIAKRQGA
jgi:gluconate 2-dehydrogenase